MKKQPEGLCACKAKGRAACVLNLCVVVTLLVFAHTAWAQDSQKVVILSAAPDVPPGLLARVRGELLQDGVRLAAPQDAVADSTWMILRQGTGVLLAELRSATNGAAPQSLVISVALPASDDPADRINAYSELALRAGEMLNVTFLPAPVPKAESVAPLTPAKKTIAQASSKFRASSRQHTPLPWLITAAGGAAYGLLQGQAALLGTLSLSRLLGRSLFLGVRASMPMSALITSAKAGSAAVTHAWGGGDFGYRGASASGRYMFGGYLSAGIASTQITGSAMEPARSNRETLWSFMTGASVFGSVLVGTRLVATLQVSAMTFLPRAGVRIDGVAVAHTSVVMPSATLGMGMAW